MEVKKIKKILKFLILTIIIVGIVIIIGRLKNNKENSNENDKLINKAEKIYGNDFCQKSLNDSIIYEDKEHPLYGATVMSSYVCKICGKKQQHSSSPTPQICKSCATITNRCQDCGKLLKK